MNLIKLFLMLVIVQVFTIIPAQAKQESFLKEKTLPVRNIEKDGQIGAGIVVGALSGITLEYWNSPSSALNLTLSTAQDSRGVGLAHNWMFNRAFSNVGQLGNNFVPYIGVGLLVGFGRQTGYLNRDEDSTFIAVQAPLGLEFLPRTERFSIFGELSPSLELTHSQLGFFTAGVGARFYF